MLGKEEKVNDFIDVWAYTLNINDIKFVELVKNDIIERCNMYKDTYPSISVIDDPCEAYIIKPTNGVYSLEDFLLNRLMLGLMEVGQGALEGNAGEYTAYHKSMNIAMENMEAQINERASRHKGLEGKAAEIVEKTTRHELGHCLKSSFSDGCKGNFQNRDQTDVYKKLVINLSNFENGKYSDEIKGIGELDFENESENIKTGVNDSKSLYKYDARFTFIDELLNETEALELNKSKEVQEKWPLQDETQRDSQSGNYANVYNYMSGYRAFTGYGSILKSLLGKENAFYAEYISSKDIFKQFDMEYADIVKEVWGIEPEQLTPMQCLYFDFNEIRSGEKIYNEKIMLKLDEFFAKCYAKKIEKIIQKNDGKVDQEFSETTLKEIEDFQMKLTTNDDPQKRDALVHNVVFNNIKTRVNELAKQNNQEHTNEITNMEVVEEKVYTKEQAVEQPKEQSNKMKWIKQFIEFYDMAEEEYQYDKRVDMEKFNMKSVLKGIDLGMFRGNMAAELQPKWIANEVGDEFIVQYSQKQISAMARLLKAADNLTIDGERNYLAEFADIPDIDYMLLQMKKSEYMKELASNARENQQNGTLPNYPKTLGEQKKESQQNYIYRKQQSQLASKEAEQQELQTEETKITEIEKLINMQKGRDAKEQSQSYQR